MQLKLAFSTHLEIKILNDEVFINRRTQFHQKL